MFRLNHHVRSDGHKLQTQGQKICPAKNSMFDYIYMYVYTATCKKIRTFWIWEVKYIGFIMLQTRVEYQY